MSDPLEEYEREIRERSQSMPERVEAKVGMPFEQLKELAEGLFRDNPSDAIIRQVRHHLIESGISMDQLNVSLEAMVEAAKKHVSFVKPEHDGPRTVEDMKGSMLYLNYMYLGFLVTEYADFLFATEE